MCDLMVTLTDLYVVNQTVPELISQCHKSLVMS